MGGLKQWGRVIGVAAATGLSAVVLLASPAAAAAGSVAVSPGVVTVGGTVTISGSVDTTNCPLSDQVTLTSITALFPRAGFGPMASRNASGAFAITYTVPTSTPPGTYSIGLRCGGGNVGVEARLQVTAQVSQVPVRAPQAGLGGASTGDSNAAAWAAAGGVASILAGLLIFMTVWRRHSSS